MSTSASPGMPTARREGLPAGPATASTAPIPRHPGRTRRVLAVAGLLACLLGCCLATLNLGELGIPLAELPGKLVDLLHGGGGFALTTLRGPRLAVALGAGAALGAAGALFQRATANPLVTPDVIGITSCAGAGTALATMTGLNPALGALAGAALAGVIVPWVTTTGFRNPAGVIVAGIGVAAASSSVTQFVLVRTGQSEALAIASALTGSLVARAWSDALVIWLVLVPCLLVALVLRPELDLVALGDETAHGLGSRPGAVRTLALVLGIVLTAAAVATAGPITFVALTSPHLARWATGRPAMGSAALTGALVVVAADLAVQHWAALDGLPVGVVTSLIGGAFLGVLLVSQLRKDAL